MPGCHTRRDKSPITDSTDALCLVQPNEAYNLLSRCFDERRPRRAGVEAIVKVHSTSVVEAELDEGEIKPVIGHGQTTRDYKEIYGLYAKPHI